MEPIIHHLSSEDGANPAQIADCGAASLRQCLDYAAQLYGWRYLLLPLTGELEPVPLEDITDEDLDEASISSFLGNLMPDGAAVRRIVTHALVIAIVSDSEGRHLFEAAEIRALATPYVDTYSTVATPQYGWDKIDEEDENEFEDEDEDELEDEDEDELEGDEDELEDEDEDELEEEDLDKLFPA